MVTRTAVYFIGYLAGVSVLILFNLRVLGLGEEELLGYFGYLQIWIVFYSPLALIGALVASWKPVHSHPSLHRQLLGYFALTIFVFLEISMLLDLSWQLIIAEYLLGLVCFVGIRRVAVARRFRNVPT